MNIYWDLIGIIFIGSLIYGIHEKGELKYLEKKKVRDYNLNDVLNIVLISLMFIMFIRMLYSML